ncbi:MAG: indolepyruvate oxidoreductase subunit beta [Chloroflexota bacterium]
MEKLGVLLVGVGGQGVILASDIVGETALRAGYDVKKTDTLGMAQRGGSVMSHVRMADSVRSPLMKEGDVDCLVAFEKLEAARWVSYLRPDGVAIVNDYKRPPLSVNLGMDRYPSDAELEAVLRGRTGHAYFIEASRRAAELGNARVVNMFMLGYLSLFTPIAEELWRECMTHRLPEALHRINLAAFDQGRREAASVLI